MEDRFRVYDMVNDEWVIHEVLLSKRGDMHQIVKSRFGKEYIGLMSDTQYVYQLNTLSMDKYGNNVYEGDICQVESEDLNCIGIVIYNGIHASYALFCNDGNYYAIAPEITKNMSVVGNAFDNQEMFENILYQNS